MPPPNLKNYTRYPEIQFRFDVTYQPYREVVLFCLLSGSAHTPMDRTERFYRIEQLLQDRKLVPLRDFLDELEVSRATFKRDIEYLRDRLHAPIEYDRDAGGYRFGKPAQAQGGPRHELPGLWFNASEVHALLTMQHLLKGVEPGLLAPHVDPLLARLRGMLATDDLSVPEVERRIKIIRMAARKMKPAYFEVAASATLKRRRLAVRYWSRYKDEVSERELSPQRLVFYRGNWYLDAWCHLRKGIRSFGLDAIENVQILDVAAYEVDTTELRKVTQASYGIFSGQPTGWAVLRFTPHRAQWVESEVWHPEQITAVEPDGSYMLKVPYSDDRELLGDILRFGADVQVLAPKELRAKVQKTLLEAVGKYI